MSLQDSIANEEDYVELGLHCADICKAIDRGMNGKRLDDLSRSVCEAINQLTTWVQPEMYGLATIDNTFDHRTVAEIQGKATKHTRRSRVSRFLRSKNDKEKIAAWKSELDRILQVFTVRLFAFILLPLIVHTVSRQSWSSIHT